MTDRLPVYIVEAAGGSPNRSEIYVKYNKCSGCYLIPIGNVKHGYATIRVKESWGPIAPGLEMEMVASTTPENFDLLKGLSYSEWWRYIRDSRWRREIEDTRAWGREIVRSFQAQEIMFAALSPA